MRYPILVGLMIESFTKMKLAKPINEGWLFSKDKNSVKIFASYDLDPNTKKLLLGIGR